MLPRVSHRFSLCGRIVIEKLPEGLSYASPQRQVTLHPKRQPDDVTTLTSDNLGAFCADVKPGTYVLKVSARACAVCVCVCVCVCVLVRVSRVHALVCVHLCTRVRVCAYLGLSDGIATVTTSVEHSISLKVVIVLDARFRFRLSRIQLRVRCYRWSRLHESNGNPWLQQGMLHRVGMPCFMLPNLAVVTGGGGRARAEGRAEAGAAREGGHRRGRARLRAHLLPVPRHSCRNHHMPR